MHDVDTIIPVRLARHQRATETFDALFGASAADVLGAMDAAGDDIPNRTPDVALAIDRVGVRWDDVPIAIADPFGGVEDVPAVCRVDVGARVPARRRGVHLSRIAQVAATMAGGRYRDVSELAERIVEVVADKEYGAAAATVTARIPYVEVMQIGASSRAKPSLQHLHVIARQTRDETAAHSDLGLRVTHIVACPCVQQTFRHAKRLGAGVDQPRAELMTHSQRCTTRLLVRDVQWRPTAGAMLAAVDRVLVRTCNTLPRDAELALVYRAHRRPQFIEDALRAAAAVLAQVWPHAGSFRALTARSRSVESIHEHDLIASLRVRADEPMLWRPIEEPRPIDA
jgi:GTP cyclohydrolase I/GTP cyclohydrolase-4